MNTDKLREVFPETTVYKDPALIATFKTASIPAFLRDWIIKRKADVNGRILDKDELSRYMGRIIPQRADALSIKEEARNGGESRKFLARIAVDFNGAKNITTFEVPELGFRHGETLIEDYVWQRIKGDVLKTSGGWGLISIGYLPPDKEREYAKDGRFTLMGYKNFCPYKVNLESFRAAREHFTIEEWMDVLLGAIDYNPDGYVRYGVDGKPLTDINGEYIPDLIAKRAMLMRLLPFVEPRVNLLELAPKGTGKSYLFGSVGKYGWLVSGGTLSRAKMFRDMSKKQDGLVATSDFVALDEIQSIQFPDSSEMQGALKAYMEQGYATFGQDKVRGEAGIILLGNIPQEDMSETRNMFKGLPYIFNESALIDRFHGFIRGRCIPRMNELLKINGWALNTEYFSEIMHLMRAPSECLLYRSVVEEAVSVPSGADTRDTEAVLRLCTAFLKLLFPNVIKIDSLNLKEFNEYCLRPAVAMRKTIRTQLQILDPLEYGKKNMAEYGLKDACASLPSKAVDNENC